MYKFIGNLLFLLLFSFVLNNFASAQEEFSYQVTDDTKISGSLISLNPRRQLEEGIPKDNILIFNIKAAPDGRDGITGTGLFELAYNFFKPKIKGIMGHWVYGDNLKAFKTTLKRLTRNFKKEPAETDLAEAVFATWTGKRAASIGFKKFKVLDLNLNESDPMVNVIFY